MRSFFTSEYSEKVGFFFFLFRELIRFTKYKGKRFVLLLGKEFNSQQ